jgi:hypothetical protein
MREVLSRNERAAVDQARTAQLRTALVHVRSGAVVRRQV